MQYQFYFAKVESDKTAPSCSSWSELQRSLHSSLPHVGVEAEASSVLRDAKGHLEAADFAKVGRGEA